LFGALISPTDPIAVIGILKNVGVPKSLEIKISGESLFNDGVAVVVFLVLLGIATGQSQATIYSVSMLFLQEAWQHSCRSRESTLHDSTVCLPRTANTAPR
jgi:CPA1 family monovalent cation:H+ antiporter